jgi:PPK2 family polyphosphate:nucleotide phosphotransferase
MPASVDRLSSRQRRRLHEFVQRHRVTDGRRFRLKDHDPGDTGQLAGKAQAQELLQVGIERLAALQETLYAQDRWAVLCVFQALDAAGKDGTIKHVMTGVNPQGVQVFAFKQPSAEELDHDFLWRTMRCLPERGRIGIFNRSYYEETLVVRVHPELLQRQHLPPACVTDRIWEERFEDIVAFERYLARNGIAILKVFLNVSKEEQRRRFLERLEQPEKLWKFSRADVAEREQWDAYQHAYEETIRHTARPHAPWLVVPADHKWYARLLVAAALVDLMEGLDLHFPAVDATKRRELDAVRQALEAQGAKKGRAGRRG